MEKVAGTVSESSFGTFCVADITEGKKLISDWTDGIGCNAVLEVRSLVMFLHLLKLRMLLQRSSEITVL